MSWECVLYEDNPDDALQSFMELFLRVIKKHAPLQKYTVRNCKSPWIAVELRQLIKQRELAKKVAAASCYESYWQVYEKIQNYVTVVNGKKKYFMQ